MTVHYIVYFQALAKCNYNAETSAVIIFIGYDLNSETSNYNNYYNYLILYIECRIKQRSKATTKMFK